MTERVPAELIPELPEDVTPFSEKDLTVRTGWVCQHTLDLSDLLADGSSLLDVRDRVNHLADVISATAPSGVYPILRSHNEGEYEEYHTVYEIGHEQRETDDDIRLRLLNLRTTKIAGRARRKAKWAADEAARARTRVIKEQTAAAELDLVRTLATKLGLKVVVDEESR